MGAWEKLQLGWLDHETVLPGERANTRLGPSTSTTRQPQAFVVVLPDREVTTDVGDPFEGADSRYSGAGDDLDHTMLTAKPAGATTLTAKVRYQIEQDWDCAYVGSVQDGAFTPLPTNLSTTADPNGQNSGSGTTGSTDGAWVDLTADLSTDTFVQVRVN
jgi:immune inhibitor A